jgi:4-amino-4-deoxy-L-arabinose transferase-like glycosyltransferase
VDRNAQPSPVPFFSLDPYRWAALVARIEATWTNGIRRHALLGVILLAALVVRWPDWNSLHYYGDDAEYATVAMYLAHDPLYLAYPRLEQFAPTPFVSQPPLLLYLFAIAGQLTGSIETGAVLVSLVLGVATCGILYALGAVLDRRAVGAAAASFLAFAPMHVDFSRRAFLDVGLTFFMTLTVLLLVRWSQRPTNARALAVGFAAAFTVLSKLPGVLIVPILALPLLALAARRTWPVLRRTQPVAQLRPLAVQIGCIAAPPLVFSAAYIGLVAYLGGLANLQAKLGWQADRLAAAESAAPWHYYLSSPNIGLSDQFGILFFVLAVVGALRINNISKKRWGTGRVGALALLAWPLIVTGFFVLGARKQWFYIMPVLPAVAFLGAWTLVEVTTHVYRWPDESASARARSVFRFASVAIVVMFLVVPISQSATDRPSAKPFGYGVKEAAFLIDSMDPDAGQVGTLLGRFTLHFYNGHATYHWHNDHRFVDDEVRAGRVRFVVIDTYLDLPEEREWMQGLVDAFDGRLVAEYQPASPSGHVFVYDLAPSP